MSDIFISYSHADKYFAELLTLKLREADLSVWQDRVSLNAGEHWRDAIDLGIDGAKIVVVALSKSSVASQYVTYEWSFGLAKQKPTLPVLVEDCTPHPKLEPIQYVDFRHHDDSTWVGLVQRIKELSEEIDQKKDDADTVDEQISLSGSDQALGDAIIAYMNRNNFRMISFDRVRKEKMSDLGNKELSSFVSRHPKFRKALLKRGLGLVLV